MWYLEHPNRVAASIGFRWKNWVRGSHDWAVLKEWGLQMSLRGHARLDVDPRDEARLEKIWGLCDPWHCRDNQMGIDQQKRRWWYTKFRCERKGSRVFDSEYLRIYSHLLYHILPNKAVLLSNQPLGWVIQVISPHWYATKISRPPNHVMLVLSFSILPGKLDREVDLTKIQNHWFTSKKLLLSWWFFHPSSIPRNPSYIRSA